MGKKYFVTIECESDEDAPFVEMMVVFNRIASYMVDNVDLMYGVIELNGVRHPLKLVDAPE